MWSYCFVNYAQLIGRLHLEHVSTVLDMLAFHDRVVEWAQIYKWREAVLPLAFNWHQYIINSNPLDLMAWCSIIADFKDLWLSPVIILIALLSINSSKKNGFTCLLFYNTINTKDYTCNY